MILTNQVSRIVLSCLFIMHSSFRLIFWTSVVSLMLRLAQSHNLLPRDSPELTVANTPWLDDKDLLWSSNDLNSLWSLDDTDSLLEGSNGDEFISSFFDINTDINIPSDTGLLSSTDLDNLFVSDISDMSAHPACVIGSLMDATDNIESDRIQDLQARDGEEGAGGESCPNFNEERGNFDLPVELFQNPEDFLRNRFRVPPRGQTSQPGPTPGSEDDEEVLRSSFALDLKPDENICPAETYGLSQVPVCSNPYMGYFQFREGAVGGEVDLYNVLPCMFFSFCKLFLLCFALFC